jgi:hypothetical protein
MTILSKFYSISKNFNKIDNQYKLIANNLFDIENRRTLFLRTSLLAFIMVLSTMIISVYLFADPDVIFDGYHNYFKVVSILISFTVSGGLLFFCCFLIYNAILVNKKLFFLREGLKEIVIEVKKKPIMIIFLKDLILKNSEFDNLYLLLLNEKNEEVLAMNIYNLYYMISVKIDDDFVLKRRLADSKYKPSFWMA